MKRNKEVLRTRFSECADWEAVGRLDKLKGKDVYLSIEDEKTYKTRKQNNTFHALLQCFYGSGCSSFTTFDDLREHYKRIAGLVSNKPAPAGTFTIIRERSWSDVTKENAKLTIDMLLKDMDTAGVMGSGMGKKYQEILTGMGIEV